MCKLTLQKYVLLIGTDAANDDARALEEAGYVVEVADSLQEALERQASRVYHRVMVSPELLSQLSATCPSSAQSPSTNVAGSLKESEERFRTLADNISQLAWMADENGWIFWYNKRWFDYTGTTIDEVEGWGWQKVHHPDHVEKVSHSFANGESWEDIFPLRGKDGSYRWFLSHAIPIRDEQGRLTRWLGTNTDVTELLGAQRELESQRELLTRTIDTIPVMITIYDPHLNTFRFNRHSREVLGWTEEDAADGDFMAKVYPDPDYRRIVSEYMQSLEPGWRDFRVTAKDGSQVESSWANIRLSDDTLVGIGIDIRDRKRAEEALRESEERFRLIFQATQDAVVLIDDEGRYADANPAASMIYGVPVGELLGRSIAEFTEESFDFDEAWRQFRQVGSYRSEDRIVHPDGTLSEVETTGIADVLPGRHLFVLHDITGRKRAEREVAQARAEAERRAAELESLVSSIADGVSLLDAAGTIIYINEAGKKMLAPPDGVVLTNSEAGTEVMSLDGEPLPLEQTATHRALRGETVSGMRYVIRLPWGKTMTLGITASPVRNAQGQVVGATSVFRDISDQVDYERQREELLQRERHISEVLQQALIPPDVPKSMGNTRIAVKYRPGLREAEVGGDFYDIFDLGSGKIGILIGDVAGKGLAAAIRVAAARYAIRSYAYLDPGPSRVMSLANEALCKDDSEVENILTAFFAVLDTRTGVFNYATAGHEPPVVCAPDGRIDELELGGIPMGLVCGVEYPENSRVLSAGDVVVMVTDGITEARAAGAVLFEKTGVIDYVAANCGESTESVAQGLIDTATRHAGGRLQDDAAVVVLQVGLEELVRTQNG